MSRINIVQYMTWAWSFMVTRCLRGIEQVTNKQTIQRRHQRMERVALKASWPWQVSRDNAHIFQWTSLTFKKRWHYLTEFKYSWPVHICKFLALKTLEKNSKKDEVVRKKGSYYWHFLNERARQCRQGNWRMCRILLGLLVHV